MEEIASIFLGLALKKVLMGLKLNDFPTHCMEVRYLSFR